MDCRNSIFSLRALRGLVVCGFINAVRSRFIASVVFILAMAVVVLISTIKGDGTSEGRIKLFIYYSTAVSVFILLIVNIWTSCASISRDVSSKTIQMVAVKPVAKIWIWIGKWFGILSMNLLFLAVVTVSISIAVTVMGSDGDSENGSDAGIFTSRKCYHSDRSLIDADAESRADYVMSREGFDPHVSRSSVVDSLRMKLLASRNNVQAQGAVTWRFNIDPRSDDSESAEIVFRCRFYSMGRDLKPVPSRWEVRDVEDSLIMSIDDSVYPEGPYSFSFPSEILQGEEFTVTYRNLSERSGGRSILFNPEHRVEILVARSGFYSNLLRVMIISFSVLALASAVGLACGTLFSFPVAVFATFSLIFFAAVSQYFAFALAPVNNVSRSHQSCSHEHCSHKAEKGAYAKFAERSVLLIGGVVKPFFSAVPVNDMSNGIYVPWSRVGYALMRFGGIYSLLFVFIGGFIFSRRELAGIYR